jgi:hypothetical protein
VGIFYISGKVGLMKLPFRTFRRTFSQNYLSVCIIKRDILIAVVSEKRVFTKNDGVYTGIGVPFSYGNKFSWFSGLRFIYVFAAAGDQNQATQ